MDSRIDTVVKRRNSRLQEKKDMFTLLNDSYAGGEKYIKGNHLIQYIREGSKQYDSRKKRAVYFNHVQPLVDLLIGFIFSTKPTREGFVGVEYIEKNAGSNQTLEEFMRNLATLSMMMTCGVLVDSPPFDRLKYPTMRDRLENNLNPYCLLYTPDRILDYALDEKGSLLWITLDNSYVDNSDPFVPSKKVSSVRLWMRGKYYNYIDKEGNGFEETGPFESLSEIPFYFVNWRDNNQDMIDDTIFEDIALYDRSIYNFTSCLDEMIVAGTFKPLFFPVEDMEADLPAELKTGGVNDYSVIPYNGKVGKAYFEGPGLQDVVPFLSAIEMYFTEILKKIGVESAEEQSIVKTGVARKYDFEKTKAYLVSGIEQLQKVERTIYKFVKMWEGEKNPAEPKVTYYKTFLEDDIEIKLARYARLLTLPYDALKKAVHKLIIKNSISNELTKEEMDEILTQVDSGDADEVDLIAEAIKKAKTNNLTEQGESDELTIS